MALRPWAGRGQGFVHARNSIKAFLEQLGEQQFSRHWAWGRQEGKGLAKGTVGVKLEGTTERKYPKEAERRKPGSWGRDKEDATAGRLKDHLH